VLVDADANATITDFIGGRSGGSGTKVAEKLIPTNHGFGTRRVPLESGYYEVYNQPNVRLVDIRETPIERITPAGIKTSDAEHEFDMIIYATGFDAITGAFDRIDVRGLGGRRLRETWGEGPRTYLGLQIVGFPNLFTLVGPHNAATFCNIPRCIEQNVDWVTALLAHMRDKGLARVEATAEAEREWTQHVHDTGRRMLSTQVDSWMMGINSNVAGKQKRTLHCTRAARPSTARSTTGRRRRLRGLHLPVALASHSSGAALSRARWRQPRVAEEVVDHRRVDRGWYHVHSAAS
jgi:hypothetical protein